jgi:hypothetical protein
VNGESDILGKAMTRLERDDFFMASVLAAYRLEFGVSEADIARQLHCTAQDLILVGLCRRPRADDLQSFVSDLNAIAKYARCDSVELAKIARAVDAVATLRRLGGGSQQTLLKAARPKRPTRRNRKSSRREK